MNVPGTVPVRNYEVAAISRSHFDTDWEYSGQNQKYRHAKELSKTFPAGRILTLSLFFSLSSFGGEGWGEEAAPFHHSTFIILHFLEPVERVSSRAVKHNT